MASASITDLKSAAPAQRPLATMKPKEQIAYLLDQRKGEIAKMLPKHLHADRLLKVAQIAATTTPALLKCDVASLVSAIGQCAQMGLEPNTVLGHAYLVPFNTKRKDANGAERWVNSVQVIVGYKGLIDLARRSGQIVSIAAHEVCENDEFECSYGLVEVLRHKPAMNNRGAVVAFYAVAHLKDGGHAFEVMSVEQVEEIMRATQSKGKYGPWKDHFVEMGRKTAIRRLAKYLPLSIEFQTAAELDSMAAAGRDQNLEANTIDGIFTSVNDGEQGDEVDPETGEVRGMLDAEPGGADIPQAQQHAHAEREPVRAQAKQEREPAQRQQQAPAFDADAFAERLERCDSLEVLDLTADEIRDCPQDMQELLSEVYHRRRQELTDQAERASERQAEPAQQQRQAAPGRRRTMSSIE